MSTRSCIIVKVRPGDIGHSFKFKAPSLPVDGVCWGKDTDKEKSKEVKVDKQYVGIYCHSCGYPDGVGEVLKDKFGTYDKALNLVVGGDCSYVCFDGVRRYANRKGEEWEYLKPKQGDKTEDIYPLIDSEYCYLYDEENGGWRVNDYDNGLIETEDGKKIPAPVFKEY